MKKIFTVNLVILFSISIAIPNSLPAVNFVILLMAAIISYLYIKWDKSTLYLMGFFLLSTVVTLFYVLVGLFNGAPNEAALQVGIIYIASPFLWILVSIGIFQNYQESRIIQYLILVTLISVASVGLFFFLYQNYGAESVAFFKKDANLNLNDGYSGATMFVYGSLIFLTAGFFGVPHLIKSKVIRSILIISLGLAALTSGRSALILSVFVGIFFNITFSVISLKSQPKLIKNLITNYLAIFFISSVFFVFYLKQNSDIDFFLVLDLFLEELYSAGGSERSNQRSELLNGAFNNFGLGSGHGVGVELVRNEDYPWRYEMIWFATLFRVGLIGSIIYFMPFFVYFYNFLKGINRKNYSTLDYFLFISFVASFIASNTNPYIEAFAFQWMFTMPVVWFFCKHYNVKAAH